VQCIACTTFVFSFPFFSVSMKHTALCTRCFMYTWSQHFMISKSRGYTMFVQFGVQSLNFTFLRNNISCGQAAQVSTDNKMFLLAHTWGLWKWSCSTTIFYLHFILQEVFLHFYYTVISVFPTMIRACFDCHDCSRIQQDCYSRYGTFSHMAGLAFHC
jgi:hypothetical protein